MFELQINGNTKLCGEVSARHCKSTWKLTELKTYVQSKGFSPNGKTKAQLCDLIYTHIFKQKGKEKEKEKEKKENRGQKRKIILQPFADKGQKTRMDGNKRKKI